MKRIAFVILLVAATRCILEAQASAPPSLFATTAQLGYRDSKNGSNEQDCLMSRTSLPTSVNNRC